MRIIAGERRGAQLFAPKGMDTRPTQAKVKESLFNMLQADVPGSRVLDLFAGSGNLALEALSRGAESAVLVDADREAAACIRRNVEKLRFADRSALYRCDWRQAVAQMKAAGILPFDLVFLDPPYRMTELWDICDALAEAGLLAPHAVLALEHRTGALPEPEPRFALYKQRAYADTEIHVYRFEEAGAESHKEE